jgi:hypothetical protein
METKNDQLYKLKNRRPFRVPEGYFKGFTDQMMSRLPEKSVSQPKKISFYDRTKPWLYMAAAFAGLILLFNVLNTTTGVTKNKDTATVQKTSPAEAVTADDDAEFLEYIEDMYTDKYAMSYIYDNFDN